MPDYNINRNSMNALKTTSSSYMQHNAIPSLFFNGENNFSVEVFFYLKSKEPRSILYGQQGKFELGVDNGQIFLNAPGFCNFIVPENIVTLLSENFYFIALTYNGSKISLFLQGYKIFETDKIGVSARSQDPLCIGIGISVYICTIRVFSEILADKQILSDNLNELAGGDSCVAWLVFSDIQPIDKSKNKLAISLVGEGARVVNLVACSSFSGMGCAQLKNKVSKNYDEFTVLGKVYPLFTSNDEMVIYTSRSATDGYTVLLRRQEDYNYRLVFKAASGELISSKEVRANRWFDFAITLLSGKITLYIDGANAGEMSIASINLKGDTNALIGTGYDDGYMDYKKGFSGYIDYIAEFEKALDSTRIEGYVDNPPFIFDKDLISSMSLNSATPSELAYDEPIWAHGDFQYVLAESTNPTNSPKGIQYFYPSEIDPLWSRGSVLPFL